MRLGFIETIGKLTMKNCVCWNGHVLNREDVHVLRWALDFEVDSRRKKWRPKRTLKKLVKEESVKVGLSRKVALFRSKLSVGVDLINSRFR